MTCKHTLLEPAAITSLQPFHLYTASHLSFRFHVRTPMLVWHKRLQYMRTLVCVGSLEPIHIWNTFGKHHYIEFVLFVWRSHQCGKETKNKKLDCIYYFKLNVSSLVSVCLWLQFICATRQELMFEWSKYWCCLFQAEKEIFFKRKK